MFVVIGRMELFFENELLRQNRAGADCYDALMAEALPYAIAVLCYVFDPEGRVLLLHRAKPPNHELYSPPGGKLEQATGESPLACAVRELEEETGVVADRSELHLTGLISETAFGDAQHWLMFLYELTRPVTLAPARFREGSLEWHDPANLVNLPMPETDRQVIWPLFWRYRGRFFSAHIDCGGGEMTWRLEQPACDVAGTTT
jgi:8-oxo-dGTP diphosphatase